MRRGELLNQVAVFKSPGYQLGGDTWGGPEELEPAYAHCHENVRRGIKHLWTDRWWPMYDRDPIDNWVHGRMLLLGDAAHPPLQYLASAAVMAIEDAKCLAAARNPAELNRASFGCIDLLANPESPSA